MKASPAKLAYIRQWQKDNPAKRSATTKKYRRSHRKETRDYMRSRRAADPQCERKYQRSSRLKNLDVRRADARARVPKWRKENPEAYALQGELRRVRQVNAPGNGITRDQWVEKLAEFGGRCAYCGRIRKLSMDHIDPLSQGGAHDVENAAPACKSCNSRKHDKPLLLWLATDRRVAA